MLEDYRNAKQERFNKQEGKIGRVVFNKNAPKNIANSALFNVSLEKGAIEVDVMADQRADANFIPEDLLKKILTEVPSTKIFSVKSNKIFCDVTRKSCLLCSKKIRLDKS